MSATITSPQYDDLLSSLQRVRVWWRVAVLVQGVMLLAATFLGLLMVGVVGDHMLHLPRWLRLSAFVLIVGSSLWVFIRHVLTPLARSFSDAAVAMHVEQSLSGAQNRLIDAIQLWDVFRQTGNPRAKRIVERNIHELPEFRLTDVVDYRPSAKVGALAIAIVAGLMVYAIGFPGYFYNSAVRIAFPFQDFAPIETGKVKVTPGDATVLRGSSIDVRAWLSGTDDRDVAVRYLMGESVWASRKMEAMSPIRFTTKFKNIIEPISYQVLAGRIQSDTYDIQVVEPLEVRAFRLKVTYPEYTGQGERRISFASDVVTVLRGAKLNLEIELTRECSSGQVHFSDGTDKALRPISPRLMAIEIDAEHDVELSFRFTDPHGFAVPEPPSKRLRVIQDREPAVVLVEPGYDVSVNESGQVDFHFQVKDDYGLQYVRFIAERKGGGGAWKLGETPGGRANRKLTGSATVSPAKLKLRPGEALTCYVETNDFYPGRAKSPIRSKAIRVRVITPKQEVAASADAMKEVIELLDDMLQQQSQNLDYTSDVRGAVLSPTKKDTQKSLQQLVAPAIKSQQELRKKGDKLAGLLKSTAPHLEKKVARMAKKEMLVASIWLERAHTAEERSTNIESLDQGLEYQWLIKEKLGALRRLMLEAVEDMLLREIIIAIETIQQEEKRLKVRTDRAMKQGLEQLARKARSQSLRQEFIANWTHEVTEDITDLTGQSSQKAQPVIHILRNVRTRLIERKVVEMMNDCSGLLAGGTFDEGSELEGKIIKEMSDILDFLRGRLLAEVRARVEKLQEMVSKLKKDDGHSKNKEPEEDLPESKDEAEEIDRLEEELARLSENIARAMNTEDTFDPGQLPADELDQEAEPGTLESQQLAKAGAPSDLIPETDLEEPLPLEQSREQDPSKLSRGPKGQGASPGGKGRPGKKPAVSSSDPAPEKKIPLPESEKKKKELEEPEKETEKEDPEQQPEAKEKASTGQKPGPRKRQHSPGQTEPKSQPKVPLMKAPPRHTRPESSKSKMNIPPIPPSKKEKQPEPGEAKPSSPQDPEDEDAKDEQEDPEEDEGNLRWKEDKEGEQAKKPPGQQDPAEKKKEKQAKKEKKPNKGDKEASPPKASNQPGPPSMKKPEGAPLPDAISASGGQADTAMDKTPAPDVPEEIGAEEQDAEGEGESPRQSPPSPEDVDDRDAQQLEERPPPEAPQLGKKDVERSKEDVESPGWLNRKTPDPALMKTLDAKIEELEKRLKPKEEEEESAAFPEDGLADLEAMIKAEPERGAEVPIDALGLSNEPPAKTRNADDFQLHGGHDKDRSADLPEAFQDLVGELLDDQQEELEDFTTSFMESGKDASGVGEMPNSEQDWPIAGTSARGITANILPRGQNLGGRARTGRAGKAFGQNVADVSRDMFGSKGSGMDTPNEKGSMREQRVPNDTGADESVGTGGKTGNDSHKMSGSQHGESNSSAGKKGKGGTGGKREGKGGKGSEGGEVYGGSGETGQGGRGEGTPSEGEPQDPGSGEKMGGGDLKRETSSVGEVSAEEAKYHDWIAAVERIREGTGTYDARVDSLLRDWQRRQRQLSLRAQRLAKQFDQLGLPSRKMKDLAGQMSHLAKLTKFNLDAQDFWERKEKLLSDMKDISGTGPASTAKDQKLEKETIKKMEDVHDAPQERYPEAHRDVIRDYYRDLSKKAAKIRNP
ncbi:MAG: hypothetical protein QGG53_04050 [Planctomycetota bacterium]|nr:hypothetical protein [Planctomycetota bacterium]